MVSCPTDRFIFFTIYCPICTLSIPFVIWAIYHQCKQQAPCLLHSIAILFYISIIISMSSSIPNAILQCTHGRENNLDYVAILTMAPHTIQWVLVLNVLFIRFLTNYMLHIILIWFAYSISVHINRAYYALHGSLFGFLNNNY